jgi:hypothetical protein
MLTRSTIMKEIKDFPADRLEELHQFINSLTPTSKQTESARKKILSFGGILGDMSQKDYTGFVRQTKKARTKLFDRTSKL